MALTLVFSGPASARTQAAFALKRLGDVEDDGSVVASTRGHVPLHEFNHNLPDLDPEGDALVPGEGRQDPSVAFLTVHSDDDDVDGPSAAVAPYGWVLRSHFVAVGKWARSGQAEQVDQLEALKSSLRSQGIDV